MILFNRHESCIGLTLFRLWRWNVELWYCPKGYRIKPHSHPNEHIELMFIYGRTTFYRIIKWTTHTVFGDVYGDHVQHYKPKWYHVGRTFSVKPGIVHYFEVSDRPLIFINFATFTKGHKPTSASVDFKEV
jgi:hypothetical protein